MYAFIRTVAFPGSSSPISESKDFEPCYACTRSSLILLTSNLIVIYFVFTIQCKALGTGSDPYFILTPNLLLSRSFAESIIPNTRTPNISSNPVLNFAGDGS